MSQVVLAEKPVISDDTNVIDPHLLDVLLANISTLASVFHKPPEAFVSRVRVAHEGSPPPSMHLFLIPLVFAQTSFTQNACPLQTRLTCTQARCMIGRLSGCALRDCESSLQRQP